MRNASRAYLWLAFALATGAAHGREQVTAGAFTFGAASTACGDVLQGFNESYGAAAQRVGASSQPVLTLCSGGVVTGGSTVTGLDVGAGGPVTWSLTVSAVAVAADGSTPATFDPDVLAAPVVAELQAGQTWLTSVCVLSTCALMTALGMLFGRGR